MSTQSEVSGSSIALGGEPLKVFHRDGTEETVLVRELEIDPGLMTFVDLMLKEKELAEFICQKELGWSKKLKRESLLDVVEKAKELNFSVARRLMEHRVDTVKNLKPFGIVKSPSPSTGSAPASG